MQRRRRRVAGSEQTYRCSQRVSRKRRAARVVCAAGGAMMSEQDRPLDVAKRNEVSRLAHPAEHPLCTRARNGLAVGALLMACACASGDGWLCGVCYSCGQRAESMWLHGQWRSSARWVGTIVCSNDELAYATEQGFTRARRGLQFRAAGARTQLRTRSGGNGRCGGPEGGAQHARADRKRASTERNELLPVGRACEPFEASRRWR